MLVGFLYDVNKEGDGRDFEYLSHLHVKGRYQIAMFYFFTATSKFEGKQQPLMIAPGLHLLLRQQLPVKYWSLSRSQIDSLLELGPGPESLP